MKYVVALLLALVLNASANLLMKLGAQSVASGGGLLAGGPAGAVRTLLRTPTLLIGLVLFGLNAGFYMYALQSKALKISVAYPVMVGGGFALIAIVARLHPALSERLSWTQLTGVALILAGILLVASGMSETQP